MKVVSVNISRPREIEVNGKKELTGYFKQPIQGSIFLTKNGVVQDSVVDIIHHGGLDKACYIYSADHYSYWVNKYPVAETGYGLFGENVTVKSLSEDRLRIGDVIRIGGATVQISQPRQPCYKLGIRFGTQKITEEFRRAPFPGIYVRVLSEGEVKNDDHAEILESDETSATVTQMYTLLYSKNPEPELLKQILSHPLTGEGNRNYLHKKFGRYM